MHFQNFRRLTLVVLGVLTLSACGGGGKSSGSGEFESALAPEVALNSLSAAEQAQLCQDIDSYAQDRSTRVNRCTLIGVVFATSDTPNASAQGTCADIREACLDEGVSSGEADPADTCLLESPENYPTCTASIGVLEGCLNDYFDSYSAALDDLSCADAENSTTARAALAPIFTIPTTARCNQLASECPGLFSPSAETE